MRQKTPDIDPCGDEEAVRIEVPFVVPILEHGDDGQVRVVRQREGFGLREDVVAVAGDDTGLLIMRNAASAERLCMQLRRTYKR